MSKKNGAAVSVPEGYKMTEVGVIPEEWECRTITEIARLESGHTPSRRRPDYWNGDVQWVSLHDTGQLDRRIIESTAKSITEEGLNNSSARMLPAGTVVFSRTATVGKAAIIGNPMATSQDFANYVCGHQIHNLYLVYLFRGMRQTWRNLMAGSIHNTIYMPVFKSLKIPVPPLPEQRAIAAALTDTDDLIESLEHLIAKKRRIKEGAMGELLSGERRLEGFEGKWERKSLEELEAVGSIRLYRGKVISKVDIRRHPGGYPIYSSSSLNKGLFGSYGQYALDEELITWSIDGGGHFFYRSKHKFSVTNVCGYMRVDDSILNYRFLAEQLQFLHSQKDFDYMNKAHPSVIRKEYRVVLPSLPEQHAIATILSDMAQEIEALEEKLAKMRRVKEGMMGELLGGRVRLV